MRQTPQVVTSVTQLLTANMTAIRSCLPKHMTPERMCRIAVQTISKSPQLQRCTPQSLVAAIVEASSLGLEIDVRGQAYLVPYNTTVTLIPGYKGLMDLAYRSGRVANIYAETVCEHDEFVCELGLAPKLTHKPNLDDRGGLRAVYAVARLKDADPVFVVLNRKDVEKIRKASKAKSGPWNDWEDEMWKKTAIRRLCKYLPLSPEMQRAIAIDEAAEANVDQHLAEAIIDLPPESFGNETERLNEVLSGTVTSPAVLESSQEPDVTRNVGTVPEEECATIESRQKADVPVDAAERKYPCPRKDGALVEDEDCFHCSERDGCPARIRGLPAIKTKTAHPDAEREHHE